jgi:hypothetical protein
MRKAEQVPALATLLRERAGVQAHFRTAKARRLTTRGLSRRRRQRLQELLQQQANQQEIKEMLGGQ